MNRVSGYALVALAAIALATIVIGWLTVTYPLPEDEGTGAHIFQIATVLQLPATVVFLASADWSRPLWSLRPMVLQLAMMLAAFATLYHFEHL